MDPEVWLKFLTTEDLGFLGAVSVLSFVLQRWEKCPSDIALFFPIVLGGVYGCWVAFEQGYAFSSHILYKGVMQAAGAALVARAAHLALRKWWGEDAAVVSK